MVTVTVTFLSSLQEYQGSRTEEVAKRLRAEHPEWAVMVLSPEASKALLAKYKLQFGPAIVVNDRVEFVGIPRYRMLVERIAMVAAGKISPRTAAPPAAPTPPPVARPAPAKATPPPPTPPPNESAP
jgi:hypothetical protein